MCESAGGGGQAGKATVGGEALEPVEQGVAADFKADARFHFPSTDSVFTDCCSFRFQNSESSWIFPLDFLLIQRKLLFLELVLKIIYTV